MSLPPLHLKARKRFGQNFLINDSIIADIVAAINPQEGQSLVEIGPGHAALTRPVLDRCKKLTAIELDRDLVELLIHDPFLKGLQIISADALKTDFRTLDLPAPLRIFGNLPYNITSPLIFHLLSFTNLIADMHFMLQKEVVERLCAVPGNRDFGRLTVMAQFYAQIYPIMVVPAHAFRPAPKVTSAVVRLVPRQLDEANLKLAQSLNLITTTAFSARRKTIHNALGKLFSDTKLQELGIDPQLRPENLSVNNFLSLARVYEADHE